MAVLVEVAIETGGTEAEETMLLVVSSMMEDEEDAKAAEEAIWVEVTTAAVSLVRVAATVEVASTMFEIRLNQQTTRDIKISASLTRESGSRNDRDARLTCDRVRVNISRSSTCDRCTRAGGSRSSCLRCLMPNFKRTCQHIGSVECSTGSSLHICSAMDVRPVMSVGSGERGKGRESQDDGDGGFEVHEKHD